MMFGKVTGSRSERVLLAILAIFFFRNYYKKLQKVPMINLFILGTDIQSPINSGNVVGLALDVSHNQKSWK